jgi:hypothetical protein
MKNIAILIPVHNNIHLTRQCIQQLEIMLKEINEQNSINYKIILIDDGSSDGTGQWARDAHPDVTLLEGNGNLWWSGGINKGAHHAMENGNTDFLLLWNNDIIPEKNYFKEMNRIIEATDNNTIIGSKICSYHNPDKIWSVGGKFNPLTGKFLNYGQEKEINHGQKLPEPDWLTGMGTLIPRKTVQTIGYWNEKKFPQYYGDADYTYRAKKKGFKLKVFPELIIYNDTQNSGMIHNGKLSKLAMSLQSNRSKYNLKKDLMFYNLHARTWWAYFYVFKKYFRYVGGFVKWKILQTCGVKKKVADS